MKYFILPVLLLSMMACAISRTPRKATDSRTIFTVSGAVLETADYCGGAAPSPEQLHPAPVGKQGIKLYIRPGKTNNWKNELIDSIVSGENGVFSISLPAGDYCIAEATKKGKPVVPKNNQFEQWDSACYMENYQQCDYSLSVKENMENVKIIFTRHCPWTTPCMSYNGPLPPAAPPSPRGDRPPHQE